MRVWTCQAVRTWQWNVSPEQLAVVLVIYRWHGRRVFWHSPSAWKLHTVDALFLAVPTIWVIRKSETGRAIMHI